MRFAISSPMLEPLGPFWGVDLELDGACQVPELPGIYIWKRAAIRAPLAGTSSERFTQWLEQHCTPPLAVFERLHLATPSGGGEVRVRPGLLGVQGVRIGGTSIDESADQLTAGPWPSDGLSDAHGIASDAIDRFAPVVYVGETKNLQTRLKDRAVGSTGLLARLQTVGVGLEQLVVYCYAWPNSTASWRKRLESRLTDALLAPLVRRKG